MSAYPSHPSINTMLTLIICFWQEIWRERSSRWHYSHQSNGVCRLVPQISFIGGKNHQILDKKTLMNLYRSSSLRSSSGTQPYANLSCFVYVRCMCVYFASYHVISRVSLILIRSEFWRFPLSWRNFGAGGWLKWLCWQGNHTLHQVVFVF